MGLKQEDDIQCLHVQGLKQNDNIRLWKNKGETYKENFSSKDTWELMRIHNAEFDWYNGFDFVITPKYSFTAWVAIKNRLPTGDRMLRWNAGSAITCTLFPEPNETRNHLFYKCIYSEEIWKNLTHKLLDPQFTSEWDEIIGCLTYQNRGKVQRSLLQYVFQATLFAIWSDRNRRRLEIFS